MRLRDLQTYIDALNEDSEFAIFVRSIETGKDFGLSYAPTCVQRFFVASRIASALLILPGIAGGLMYYRIK